MANLYPRYGIAIPYPSGLGNQRVRATPNSHALPSVRCGLVFFLPTVFLSSLCFPSPYSFPPRPTCGFPPRPNSI